MTENGGTALQKPKCGAPCIVNVKEGFFLFFCDIQGGHGGGGHQCSITDPHTKIVGELRWTYTGSCTGDGGSNWEIPLPGPSCSESHLILATRLLQSGGVGIGDELVTNARSHQLRLHCGRAAGHSKVHSRYGFYGTLGISWWLTWHRHVAEMSAEQRAVKVA